MEGLMVMMLIAESWVSFTEGARNSECLFSCWILERETRDRDELQRSLKKLWERTVCEA